jgi:hypothetical protein
MNNGEEPNDYVIISAGNDARVALPAAIMNYH